MLLAGIAPPSTSFLLLLLILCASPAVRGGASHNITSILAGNPDFAEFGAALSGANLTAEIDSRATITVLAVDNAAMAEMKARRLQPMNFRYALSLHVLLDYFDDAKLRGLPAGGFALAATLFQASGHAPGSAGIVNITEQRVGGRVAFAPYGTAADAPPAVFYLKSVKESPYDIAVLQVSAVISSPAAEGQALAPPPLPVSTAPVSPPAPAPGGGQAPSPTSHHQAPPPKPAHTPDPTPKPVDTPPAAAPEESPADQKGHEKNRAAGTAQWSLSAAIAAAVPAIALIML